MMGGPRGGFFGPGPGRGGTLMDTMRSGGGYGGGKPSSQGYLAKHGRTRDAAV